MGRTTEYTTPLPGRPYYVSTGIIKALDSSGASYPVSEISYQIFDDQNYQYVFSPYWSLIDMMPDDLFNGIPGIDFDVRKEKYYRVNITPSFIEMRSPSPGREDLWELMESAGLDYYDRFEWILRSEMRCGDDNLVVVRKRNARKFNIEDADFNLNDFLPGDSVEIDAITDLAESGHKLSYNITRLLASGAEIVIRDENRTLSSAEKQAMLYLLKHLREYSERPEMENRKAGIKRAKAEGRYKGRKKLPLDPLMLQSVAYEFKTGNLKEAEAMEKLGISSRSTFYRRIKEQNSFQ